MTFDYNTHKKSTEKTWFEKRRDLKSDSSFELNGIYYPHAHSKDNNGEKTYKLLNVEYGFKNGKLYFLKD